MCSRQDECDAQDATERFMLQQELESMAVAYLEQDQEEEEEHQRKQNGNGESAVVLKGTDCNQTKENGGDTGRDGVNENKNQKRWKLLSGSLLRIPLNHKATDAFKFPSFGLFDVTSMPSTATGPDVGPSESENDVGMKSSHPATSAVERNWCTIRVNSVPGLLFKVCTVKPVFSHKELHGYNNTGNVQIWASEECMSMYCLENQQIFKGKSVIELGAGMTALAGLIVAAECHPERIVLTDGNEKAVENIGVIIENNPFYLQEKAISRILKWDEDVGADLEGSADIVLCSDCLFFDEGRAPLVQCLKKLIKHSPQSQVILIQPRRRGTMQKFLDLVEADGYFRHEVSERVTEEIQNILETKIQSDQMYEADLHQSILIRLWPKSS